MIVPDCLSHVAVLEFVWHSFTESCVQDMEWEGSWHSGWSQGKNSAWGSDTEKQDPSLSCQAIPKHTAAHGKEGISSYSTYRSLLGWQSNLTLTPVVQQHYPSHLRVAGWLKRLSINCPESKTLFSKKKGTAGCVCCFSYHFSLCCMR